MPHCWNLHSSFHVVFSPTQQSLWSRWNVSQIMSLLCSEPSSGFPFHSEQKPKSLPRPTRASVICCHLLDLNTYHSPYSSLPRYAGLLALPQMCQGCSHFRNFGISFLLFLIKLLEDVAHPSKQESKPRNRKMWDTGNWGCYPGERWKAPPGEGRF